MSRMKRPTRPVGLYDPTYEHDACGVAFVARLDGKPTHETVRRAIVALENLEHRGAAGADPNTGDGAGILLQLPDAFIRGVLEEDLPPPGAYGVCVCFLPQDDARRAELEELLARTVEDEGQRVVAWRDVPVDKDYVGITANFFAPYVKHLVVAASDELAAGPGRLRAQAVRDPPRGGDRRGPGPRDPQLQLAHDRLQGDAHLPAAARLLPRPAGPADRVGARAGPLALLDEHVPELGAGPPVPDDRPQRRDQHAARQRQLDARARVPARLGAVRRRPAEGAPDRPPRRLGLGDLRQRARAARRWRAARCRTR